MPRTEPEPHIDLALPAEPAPAPALTLEGLAALMVDMGAQIQALRTDMQQQQDRQPRFQPLELDHISPKDLASDLAAGQGRDGDKARLLVGTDSHRVPYGLEPRFRKGARIRINPDAVRDGAARPWGEVLEQHHCSGVGVVRFVCFLSPRKGWKYMIHVPGLMTGKKTDGFYDEELLGA